MLRLGQRLLAAGPARAALTLGASAGTTVGLLGMCQPPALSMCQSSKPIGEISTHVISKLGKPSVDGARVRVYYNGSYDAGALSPGWALVKDASLSASTHARAHTPE